MKDFKQKSDDFLSKFGSRGEEGKLSHSSLDKEFIFDFLGVYFFGDHSKLVKNDHDELKATRFFFSSQNAELDKLVQERIDSFFDIENLRKELSHKLYVEKKTHLL